MKRERTSWTSEPDRPSLYWVYQTGSGDDPEVFSVDKNDDGVLKIFIPTPLSARTGEWHDIPAGYIWKRLVFHRISERPLCVS